MEWLAGRTKLESFVRVALAVAAVRDDETTRPLKAVGVRAADALLAGSDAVGVVMDEIATAAADLLYVRPSHIQKGSST